MVFKLIRELAHHQLLFFTMKDHYTIKYCDASSILLINPQGMLKRLYCPFRVQCKQSTGPFKQGMWVWVEEVSVNAQDQLLFSILDTLYLYAHFDIKTVF
ncbi:hypothetical protein EV199_1751 [Pseudobacter ginsenosidimutans]|uniref:Uncharacterized protein n=2 Tax=Pseudobacter ginsenosidimutans TaxID=661488 RepID=A0A4Q7N4E3_9BACT|nr:hypothetical protein EV199_1751 [Pseudobacter ginsenosidimutans]